MLSTYTWSPRVERLIEALPLTNGRIPGEQGRFWSVVEASGDAALPPEVLAYLVRVAYQCEQNPAAERLFALLWDRFAGHVVTYARGYIGRLQRKTTPEDVVVDVFTTLARRLREAVGVTFYEACFLVGLKRLTLDKVQRMADEPLVSLTVRRDEDDDEDQRDVEDTTAVDPQGQAEENEERAALREALPERLRGLPPKVQQTATLLMQGLSEKDIALAVGTSTRMVTNYKAALRRALVEFAVSIHGCDPEADLARLVDLYADVQAADGKGPAPAADELREQMRLPGHDPATDRWLVEEAGAGSGLLAGCMVWKPPAGDRADMELVVHPDWRRRGIGSMLLGRAAGRARALGAASLGVYVADHDAAALAFARTQGFAAVAAFTELQTGFGVASPAPAWPDGFQVRTYDTLNDPAILVQAMNRCYAGQWGHHAVTEADLANWLPDLRHDGIFLAFASSGEVAGTCRVEIRQPNTLQPETPAGYVDAPGVAPEYRGTELRLALLLAAFRWLRDAGYDRVGLLSWGDDEATLAMYESVGFAVARRSIYHQRPLA